MIWIRLDTDDGEIRTREACPLNGEWVSASEARRIVREHNERKAREEQSAEGDLGVHCTALEKLATSMRKQIRTNYDKAKEEGALRHQQGSDESAAEIARFRALPDLIRKRYPRMLERGNPLYDGVLAAMMERCDEQPARLRAQQGAVLVPGLTGSDIENEWRRLHLGVDGDPDEDAFSAFEEGTKQGYDLAASRAHSVPSSRVLKDGEVAVPLEEWEAAGNLLFSARTAWVECETSGECDMSAVTKAAKAWDALRAQGKEGAT